MSVSVEQFKDDLYGLLSDYDRDGNGISIDQVDSFEFIQIMLGIEEAYDIVFDEEMMVFETLKDVGVLAQYIANQINANIQEG